MKVTAASSTLATAETNCGVGTVPPTIALFPPEPPVVGSVLGRDSSRTEPPAITIEVITPAATTAAAIPPMIPVRRRERLPASLDLPAGGASRRYAYPCLDWSERRDHLAGSFAVALLEHGLAQGWLRRAPDSRALTLTPAGSKTMAPWLR